MGGRPIDDHFTVYGQLNNGGKCLVRAHKFAMATNDLGLVVAGTKGVPSGAKKTPKPSPSAYLGSQTVFTGGAVNANDGFLNDFPPAT